MGQACAACSTLHHSTCWSAADKRGAALACSSLTGSNVGCVVSLRHTPQVGGSPASPLTFPCGADSIATHSLLCGSAIPPATMQVPLEDVLQWEQKQKQQQDQRPGAGSTPPAAPLSDSDVEEVVLDWKGEPMKISPGDKLPFKFL